MICCCSFFVCLFVCFFLLFQREPLVFKKQMYRKQVELEWKPCIKVTVTMCRKQVELESRYTGHSHDVLAAGGTGVSVYRSQSRCAGSGWNWSLGIQVTVTMCWQRVELESRYTGHSHDVLAAGGTGVEPLFESHSHDVQKADGTELESRYKGHSHDGGTWVELEWNLYEGHSHDVQKVDGIEVNLCLKATVSHFFFFFFFCGFCPCSVNYKIYM